MSNRREVWVVRSAGGYVGRYGEEGVPWHKARLFVHHGDIDEQHGTIVPIFIEEPE